MAAVLSPVTPRCARSGSSQASGEFWLNLQKLYELRRAEQKNRAAISQPPSLDDGDGLRVSE